VCPELHGRNTIRSHVRHRIVRLPLWSSPLSASTTPSLFHSRLKTYLLNKSFPPSIDFWSLLNCLHRSLDWTGLIMLISLFLVRFSFKFSVLFHVVDQDGCPSVFDWTLNTQYRIVLYENSCHLFTALSTTIGYFKSTRTFAVSSVSSRYCCHGNHAAGSKPV